MQISQTIQEEIHGMLYMLKIKLKKRINIIIRKRQQGSMTVEAAFIVPFFLLAWMNLLSIINIYGIQSNMSQAMHATAKEMAVLEHGYEEATGKNAEGNVLDYVYAAERVYNRAGKDYLNNSQIVGGIYGINWFTSKIMEDDCIDLRATYMVKPMSGLMGFNKFCMYNRVKARAWTGYDNTKVVNNGRDEQIVYITPEGSAYHTSKSCSYLKLSIRGVAMENVDNLRNSGGAKYYACDECGSSCSGIVYITDYGTCYHSTLGCSKLKRTIEAVTLSEAVSRGRYQCSKCGN